MRDAPPESRRAVIEMINATILSRRAPGRVAVADVNWTVWEGDFWVIGGLQGSGKSDLLATAAALAKPQSGTCRLFGREIAPTYDNEGLAERLRVALVFGEGGRLFNHLTVWENVVLPLNYHQSGTPSEIESRAAALLEVLGLTDWAHSTPSGISSSWRQRVALARALALEPEVLLLDNPLAGLDPRHARWWMDFLNALSAGHPLAKGRPLTVVVAADDLRPWRLPERKFALLEDTRLVLLENPFADDTGHRPVLRELPAAEPGTI